MTREVSMSSSHDIVALSLRELVLDHGASNLDFIVNALNKVPEFLNQDFANEQGNAIDNAANSLRDELLNVIPSGYGIDNFYVVSFPVSPNYVLIMKTYPYQKY